MKNLCIYLISLILIFSCAKRIKNGAQVTKSGEETLLKFDINKDGKIDCLWAQNRSDSNNPITLWRKDDLNFDGKFDIEQYYQHEKISSEKMDLDFDGIFDAFNYYEDGIISKSEYALNNKNRIDMWIFYKDGKPIKKEVDTRYTGEPDYFEFYKNSKIDRIGRDLDGDGIIDSWE